MKKWGIDISTWQGDYDLARAKKEGVEFVIVKGGGGDDGYYKDSRFEQNYKKAKSLKLPIGVYWFSRALTVAQAEAEADFFYNNCLKGKQFELPVYIDVENRTQLNVGRRNLTSIIKAWCNRLEKKGYFVGIYSSLSFFNTYMYDDELGKRYAHWVACWSTYCNYTPKSAFGVWQFGGETNYIRSHTVAGKTTDQNYLLIDYEKKIKEKGLNGFSKGAPVPDRDKLDEDGIFGYYSVSALQKWLECYEDGEISGQLKGLQVWYPALTSVTFDGDGSPCVKKLQNYLKGKGYSIGEHGSDGYLGRDTITALQQFLNKQKYGIETNGKFDSTTAKAMQMYLNKIL